MRLSTSSSDDRLPRGGWTATWLAVLVTAACVVLGAESLIRARGWVPAFGDSVALWSQHRHRASVLRDRALIIAGASRVQLGLDTGVIRELTGLEPVQLAIDGTSPLQVLKNLADDPAITGTVLLSLMETDLEAEPDPASVLPQVKYYDETYRKRTGVEPYRRLDDRIGEFLAAHLVTRLEGARPFEVIMRLLRQDGGRGNYLVTNLDRSRDADYEKVDMPAFYAERVARHLGIASIDSGPDYPELFRRFESRIATIEPRDNDRATAGIDRIMQYVARIERRGGKVIIIRMPSSKLVWEIDQRRYPRRDFWDVLARRHAGSFHFEDFPALRAFELPDGSHLDYRDKQRFTKTLLEVLQEARLL